MFKNQYDNDVTVWSPQGRLLQLEYAHEAVKQGGISIGIRGKRAAVLLALNRAPEDLAAYQKKIFEVGEHIWITISGLSSDGRKITQRARDLCMEEKREKGRNIHPMELLMELAEESHKRTQYYGERAYGVGVLFAASDGEFAHIYELTPGGDIREYYGHAIGARSQSARTYLEKNQKEIEEGELEDLIRHGVQALKAAQEQETELSGKSVSVAIVGENKIFRQLTEEEVDEALKMNTHEDN